MHVLEYHKRITEAQLARNDYAYSHSLLYTVDPNTQTGIVASVKLSDLWLIQAGVFRAPAECWLLNRFDCVVPTKNTQFVVARPHRSLLKFYGLLAGRRSMMLLWREIHAGYRSYRRHPGCVRAGTPVRRRLRPVERKPSMILNVVLLVLSALLMAYLVYALLRPEKF